MTTIGSIFDKLVQGQTLSPAERTELVVWGNNAQNVVSVVQGWLRGGGLEVPRIEAVSTRFSFNPNEPIWLTKPAGSQTLTSGVQEAVEFTDLQLNHGNYSWSDAEPIKIYVEAEPGETVFLVGGYMHFASNSTGYRTGVLNFWDEDDTLIGGSTLFQIGAIGTVLAAPFCEMRLFRPGTRYITLEALQNSGSNLNLDFVSLGICRLY